MISIILLQYIIIYSPAYIIIESYQGLSSESIMEEAGTSDGAGHSIQVSCTVIIVLQAPILQTTCAHAFLS